MKITEQWILSNSTGNGSWTRYQIEALGITWPPKRGWIRRAIGTEISLAQANRFEAGKKVYSKKHTPSGAQARLFDLPE